MSSTDVNIKQIVDDAKRISALSRETGLILPLIQKFPMDRVDVRGWTAASTCEEKWYWRDRTHQCEIGATGTGLALYRDGTGSAFQKAQRIMALLPKQDVIFLAGAQFVDGPPVDDLWASFPDQICTIPERMIVNRHGTIVFTYCQAVAPECDINHLIARAEAVARPAATGGITYPGGDPPGIRVRVDTPDIDAWRQKTGKALDAIAAGRIEKVVLARRTDYHFDQDIDPFSMLILLMRHNPHCYAIVVQRQKGTAFISISPEPLYRREGRHIMVEAVSSTVPRGRTSEDDLRLEQKLLRSDKQRTEHRFVVEGIAQVLSPLGQGEPNIKDTAILKLERIQHLSTSITQVIDEGVDDYKIIGALHPTPAVGGVPRREALRIIGELEGFDRGWYAGPAGYLGRNDTEFAVGIRSLLVRGSTVSVFVGAGIVKGSDAESEWRELDSKDVLFPLLSAKVIG